MDLQEPTAAGAVDLGELTGPHEAIDSLRVAVDDLAGMANLAEAPLILHPNIPVKHYDPKGVYTLTSAFEGLAAGAIVVDASLPVGILSRLVRTGDAIPYEWPELGAGLSAAKITAGQMAKDQAADTRALDRMRNRRRTMRNRIRCQFPSSRSKTV